MLFGAYQMVENPSLRKMGLAEYRIENQQEREASLSSQPTPENFIIKSASSQGHQSLPTEVCWLENQEEQEDESASKKRFKSFDTLFAELISDLSRCCFFENKVKKPSRFVAEEYRSHSRFLLFEDFRI